MSQPVHVQLAELRRQAAITQEALAERAGLSESYISMIERGQRAPTLETVERLARAMGLRVELAFTPEEKTT